VSASCSNNEALLSATSALRLDINIITTAAKREKRNQKQDAHKYHKYKIEHDAGYILSVKTSLFFFSHYLQMMMTMTMRERERKRKLELERQSNFARDGPLINSPSHIRVLIYRYRVGSQLAADCDLDSRDISRCLIFSRCCRWRGYRIGAETLSSSKRDHSHFIDELININDLKR
jgi:hypothetical protein